MEVRGLGPLEVRRDGEPLALGPPQQRALLALLLVHAPATVSVDRIIDELWGETPAVRAPHAVQVYVSGLRKLLGSERIETRAPGYALSLETVTYDAARFEALLADGRATLAEGDLGARSCFEEALDLWRGPPFAGLDAYAFAAAEARRLEELRLVAIDERVAIDLALGRHASVVSELELLVAEHPWRESLWAHLMTALYRSGRQAEALAAFQRHRKQLDEELGLAPGPGLRDLQAAILAHDVSPAAAPETRAWTRDARATALPAALQLARAAGPLVGRDRELESLTATWDAAGAGAPLLRLVTGEAGIGKSRLVAELAHHVQETGGRVLYGACFEDPRPPYGPFVHALGLDLEEMMEGDEDSSSPEADQLRLLSTITGELERAAAPRALVVIEDLHWADGASLTLLSHLMRAGRGRLLFAVTSRDIAPDLTDALSAFLSGLQRHPGVERVQLAGISEAAVGEMLGASGGARTARLLHEATSGSPLFLRELIRELPADGVISGLSIGPSVRDHVAARFARLPAEDGDVLDMAAVVGAEFEARLVAQALGLPVTSILDVLDRAERFGVVVAVPGAAGRFAFSHAVLREVRYEMLPSGRRMQLHRTAGRALRDTAGATAPLVDLARHFCAAAALGDAHDAFRYARRAGEVARERFAFADAAQLFEGAERAAALLPELDAASRCDLAIQRGEALHRAGDLRYREVLLEAAAAARQLEDTDLLVRAALALSAQGWTISIGTTDHALLEVTRAALSALPADRLAERARLKAMIAAAIHLTDSHAEGRRLAQKALALAREAGDPHVLGEVLITVHWACFDPVEVAQRFAWAEEAREIGERFQNPVVLSQALRMLSQDHLETGDLAVARGLLQRADAIADELDIAQLRMWGGGVRATLATLEDRLTDTERLVGESAALAHRVGIDAGAYFGGPGGVLLIERGQWERGVELTTQIARRTNGVTAYLACLAMLHARLGQAEPARRYLRRFTDSEFEILPRNIQWAVGMVFLADAAARLRDREAAARIRELLEPVSGHTAWPGFTALWPNDLALAQLCVVLDDHEAAERHLDAAAALCERCDLPRHRIRVQLHRAWALREAGREDEAQAVAGTAVPAARALEGDGVLREARIMGLDRAEDRATRR